LRFCRRIGEKGANPRPMIIGLETEEEKRHILGRARNLHGTQFHDISVVPDLTKKQRSREARLKQEAEERNKKLTNEDRNRNEKWLVVGRRGEKRLIKGIERDVQYMGNRNGTQSSGNTNSQLLPSAPPRSPFKPRQAEKDDRRGPSKDDENGRWYRKDKEKEDTGARKKDTYGQGNKNGGEKDRQDISKNSRWETSDRWSQPQARERVNSKRGRGSASSEDESSSRQRTRRF
jgi:hypothetical protein